MSFRGRKELPETGIVFAAAGHVAISKKGLGSTAPEPFYVLSLLDEQPSSREHDPCDERGQAGEQQELIQYSGGHGTLPRTAPPQAPYASALTAMRH